MKKNYQNKFDLTHKKAFVVGGSGLLGKEIIQLLLENSADVVNLDLDNKRKIIDKNKYKKNYYYY